MAIQNSVTARNARLDSFETTVGASPVLEIRTGAPPADCAAADSGTLLASMTLPSDWMAAASSGTKAKSGTWEDAAANASGRAGHYRIKASGGTPCHEQGLVASAWLASTAYATGDLVINDSGKLYRATAGGTSASSGGPTGTGGSITDSGVTWQYIQAAGDMVLDNASIAAGQLVTITSYTKTAGNA